MKLHFITTYRIPFLKKMRYKQFSIFSKYTVRLNIQNREIFMQRKMIMREVYASEVDNSAYPLIEAAQLGDIKKAAQLIQNSIDINTVNSQQHTALMVAVLNEQAAMVDLLVKAKANVESKDKDGHSALFLAADKVEMCDFFVYDPLECTSVKIEYDLSEIFDIIVALLKANAKIDNLFLLHNSRANYLTHLQQPSCAYGLYRLLQQQNQANPDVLYVLEKLCEHQPKFSNSPLYTDPKSSQSPTAASYLEKLKRVNQISRQNVLSVDDVEKKFEAQLFAKTNAEIQPPGMTTIGFTKPSVTADYRSSEKKSLLASISRLFSKTTLKRHKAQSISELVTPLEPGQPVNTCKK